MRRDIHEELRSLAEAFGLEVEEYPARSGPLFDELLDRCRDMGGAALMWGRYEGGWWAGFHNPRGVWEEATAASLERYGVELRELEWGKVPDDDERQAIAEGANIELIIWGAGHPPVAMGVVSYPVGAAREEVPRGAPGCTCGTPPFAPPEPSDDCPHHGGGDA